MRQAAVAAAVLLALACGSVDARTHRSHSEKAAFQREHPCPSTGQRRGGCPGFIVDHVQPLCAGGPDRPANMQWQSRAEARTKDRWERQVCRRAAMRRPAQSDSVRAP